MLLGLPIVELAERPDLVPTVATWIYDEWWTETPGANADHVAELLRAHLTPNHCPLTLVASLDRTPVGTASLLEHDVGTDEWPELSPWLAAVYVVPEYRKRGIGAALVKAIVERTRALGFVQLYLLTVERQEFYAHLGWEEFDRADEKTVMTYRAENSLPPAQ